MVYQRCFTSRLKATPETVWDWMTSFDGIAREMGPWLRMTAPPGVTGLLDVDWQPGQPLFRSRIKLFGLIPVDYSDLTFLSLVEGEGFVEQSPMGSMRAWRHERHILPADTGCVLRDNLTFEPRLAGGLSAGITTAFFRHRHRMLRKHLGHG